MDLTLVQKLCIPLQPLTNPIVVLGVSREPLPKGRISHQSCPVTLRVGVFHTETLTFFILPCTKDPIILGLPWLQDHDLRIHWSPGELVAWSPQCYSQCFTVPCCASLVESPELEDLTSIPEDYVDFHDLLSKSSLPVATT